MNVKAAVLRVGTKTIGEDVAIPPRLERLEVGQEPEPWHGVMCIPTEDAGDERLVWDRRSPGSVRDAKKTFNDLVAKGMIPHRCDPTGRCLPNVMREFDAKAECVVFSPAGIPKMVKGG